ncbi:hypothetical protein [Runella zeae]|uniref:hypothetical protein n=1 Tax=Runella zeae TaxID=94255 RepID=UPI0023562139|nr:hypothetical protein [Runella zeae]
MEKVEDTLDVGVRINRVELLASSLNSQLNPNSSVRSVSFEVRIENTVNTEEKLIFVIVHTKITNEERTIVYGTLSVSCIFEIQGFEKVVREVEGKIDINSQLRDSLNDSAISTARGVMFSTFRGTFLHNAILPLIEKSTDIR